MSKASKLFLIILPVFILIAAAVLKLSLKNYEILLSKQGCGCDVNTTTGEFNPEENQAYFLNNLILPPIAALPEVDFPSVLGESTRDGKWIEIDLSDQKLTAWEGESKFVESLVSTGKWARTPTGEFNIWGKFKYTKMSGGNKEDNTYYYLPNVPYTMYFYKGFGLHGTYWHNNFGHPMSHGCINLPTPVAEQLFYWATPALPSGKNSVMASASNLGTKVVIHE